MWMNLIYIQNNYNKFKIIDKKRWKIINDFLHIYTPLPSSSI